MITSDMSPATCHFVADLQSLREELGRVRDGRPPQGVARAATVESWRRAVVLGLRPDRFVVPYRDDADVESILHRAAAPVLDELAEDLGPTEISPLLADSRGRIVARRVSDDREAARLDRVNLTPGYEWAFEHIGTNGLSDALIDAAPSWASGGEHFCEALANMTTLGVPICESRSGALLGVLSLVGPAAAANALLLPMANRAVRDIRQRLRCRPAPLDAASRDAALTASRSTRRPNPRPAASGSSRTVRPRRPTFGWDSLTEAELSVIELVAGGMTNRQIANKLWRSPYTIDAHLRHIFNKLGINSRVELVRIFASRVSAAPALIDEAAAA
jgi:DNA-binding CsgD family transcriptional regulator